MNGFDILPFGEKLRRFRERRQPKVSQQALANALGVDRQTIVAWEGGRYLPKDRTRVMELAEQLHLDEQETDLLLRASLLDPRPPWYVPYPRNPFFTGRDRELKRLHAQLQQGHTAAVGQTQNISGLGGIGKTQLAVEYAYRHHDEYHYVLWALAESVETLTSSYTEIARLLNLPEKDAEVQEVTIQAVKRWLQRQRGWLLIMDNSDAPGLLHAFLPPTIGGHLLITTRAANLSAQIAGLAHPLVMETFSDEQGALFLLHRSSLLAPDTTLDQAEGSARHLALAISHELGGLPLALDQAGAYLNVTGSSLAAYQQIYQQRRAQLLNERRGAEHPEPVATTWNISFSNVEQQNTTAADLLRFCAFLHSHPIPEEILIRGAKELGPTLVPIAADAYLLNTAIESLRAYSLLTRDPHAQTLTVHRLVQAVLRDSMPTETQHHWMRRVVHAVAAAYPGSDFAHWPTLERLLPHMLTCATWIEQASLTTPTAALLLNQAGYYLVDRARYSEAEPLLKRALAICEQELGPEHPDTAQSLNNLAGLYDHQGRYTEAELLLKRALSISEQQLGPDHPDTATSLNNLALLYVTQGKYAEAEPLLKRALAIYERELGTSHPDTAGGLNNLAALYQEQGKYAEAEPLLKRALTISEQQWGTSHPKTAIGLSNLALLYVTQDKLEEAEPLLKRALSISEQQLGPDHPDTATSLNNLARLYRVQGKLEEAEPLMKRALAICEQELGANHSDTASSLNNLALLYQDQGQYEQAEPLLKRALAICEQQLGANHPNTAANLNNLAGLYDAQGKYTEAEPLLKRALAICEQQLGANHPHTAASLASLALLYIIQGKYVEAEPLYQRALAIYRRILGRDHPTTQTIRWNYTILLRMMGHNRETRMLEEGS